jgi:site-specific recombinase XerD
MQYLQDYISFLRVDKGLSQSTISVYENNLREFRDFLGRSEFSIRAKIKRKEIKAFLFSLAEKNKPITRRLKQTTLRNYFGYLEGEDLIGNNPTKNLPMPRVETLEPKYLTEREIKKLLQAVKRDKSRFGKRNEIIIRILCETGIRLSELTGLEVGHIDTREKTMRVRRKGNSEQTLPLNNGLNNRLKRFTRGREADEPLLISSYGKRITNRRVAMMFQKYLEQARLEREGISIHSLRHSFCVRLLEKGVNLKVIQILAGHKNLSMTERYLHIAKSQLRKEVRKIELN